MNGPTLLLPALLCALSGCVYSLAPKLSMSPLEETRLPDPASVWVPPGYEARIVAGGLTFPSGVTVDEDGHVWVVEAGYSYGDVWVEPRLLRLGATTPEVVATGADAPWTGVDAALGDLFVAEGGISDGGSILRITPQGTVTTLVSELPGHGDHHTNGPVVGPDGWVYFSQGTATNSGVVGEDNFHFGWPERRPSYHDVPCADVTLTGHNYRSLDLTTEDETDTVETGAYSPFGAATTEGQRIAGQVPCNGAVMRVKPDGGPVELVAWGFRNPFGLGFGPGGRLYVTDNGPDERGSRPIYGGADVLWAVTPGAWYGWPDYVAGKPVYTSRFDQHLFKKRPKRLLMEDPGPPPEPVAAFGVHASANGIAFAPEAFGFAGEAFVAEFGDMAPQVGKVLAPVGRRVVRVDVETGVMAPFAASTPDAAPGTGLLRPVDVAFAPDGETLYILDFGAMGIAGAQTIPLPGTGVVWAVSRVAEVKAEVTR